MGARPDQEAARALATMRWRSPSRPAPYSAARNPARHKVRGFETASQLIYTERASRLAFATGFSHTARLRPPAPRSSFAYRRATFFSRSPAAQPWSGAVIGGPGPTACVTTGVPVVCSSGRRRLPSAAPITGARRLRLAVRGPVEQLGVLATLSRWRSRVQIPSGPQGSPVRFHWGPSQVR